MDCNFGQRPFAYTAPSGFKALVTTNLPDPTIVEGDDYFNTVLDTGANIKTASEAVYTHQLAWIKDRANTNNHQLIDSVRGTSAVLQSNTTAAETTYTAPSGSSVAWVWGVPSTGSSNTAGTITSTVSVNTTSGFSIVTYTGTGSAATVGHGIGIAPKMVIVKSRDQIRSWIVQHSSVGATAFLTLNTTDASQTYSGMWNDTAPTSTVFSLGSDGAVNTNTEKYVAYCFAAIPGYSAFGSYTGNQSTDGPFVYTGFRPAFVIMKNVDDGFDGGSLAASHSWIMVDNKRSDANLVNKWLGANYSSSELTSERVDFCSNGFKIRNSSTDINKSANNHIFMAFASNPFKLSLAR
jgi:hypothetical protein